MRTCPCAEDEILKELFLWESSRRGTSQRSLISFLSGVEEEWTESHCSPSIFFPSYSLFIIAFCSIFIRAEAVMGSWNRKLFEFDWGMLKIQKISTLLLMVYLFHHFHHVWRNLDYYFPWTHQYSTFGGLSCGRQNFAKKFGERSPAKTRMRAAGFSDVFAKNFAKSFHPLDKHNAVKKLLVQAFEFSPRNICHHRVIGQSPAWLFLHGRYSTPHINGIWRKHFLKSKLDLTGKLHATFWIPPWPTIHHDRQLPEASVRTKPCTSSQTQMKFVATLLNLLFANFSVLPL